MRFRKATKAIVEKVLTPFWGWYARKPHRSRYGNVSILVPPGVFHPGLFLSTRFMLHHLEKYQLQGQRFLEIGAGSGMIAIVAAKAKAHVTATDISTLAIASISSNAQSNGVEIKVVQSDLFQNVPKIPFDFIVINPPYYPRDPTNEAQFAWFCGTEFQYFQIFFRDLRQSADSNTKILMVLSEDCNLSQIARIGMENGWRMDVIEERIKWGERNFIYAISRP